MHIKVVSFTAAGAALGARVRAALPEDLVERYARGTDVSLHASLLPRLVQQAMYDCGALVFIGAAGIAVRAAAPYLRGKTEDPAVLVLDEAGRFVVPLLSGHLGGANALAVRLAAALGAQAVLTTATDVRGVFAVDSWAREQGFVVAEPRLIGAVSAALLRGETVGLTSDFPVRGVLPAGVRQDGAAENGFVLSCGTAAHPYAHTLHLIPRAVTAGIGCRRGKSMDSICAALDAALDAAGIDRRALAALATIDVKRDEPGLLQLAAALDVPLHVFAADELAAAAGVFTPSAFVEDTVGVDNVCERAAVCAAGGQLLARKRAMDGVTVALARIPLEVRF